MVKITIGGPPGSGTSTVCSLLAEKTDFEYIHAGQIFRDSAKRKGLSLSEFGELCENDPSVDTELDEKMMDIAREEGDRILEGRMTGPLCGKNRIEAFKVLIKADIQIRATRVMQRDGGTIEEVMYRMKKRESSEIKRYIKYYGLNPKDESLYDLVLDSSNLNPEEEVEIILKGMEGNH